MQNLTKLTDNLLVEAYANGNNEAFDTLLNRHKDRVLSYIFHIVKNRDLAEDIFQETFVKAIMTIKQGRYTDNGKFSAWLNRIAHNLIIDHYRREKANNTVSTDDDTLPGNTSLLNSREIAEPGIEEQLADAQIKQDVRRIIRSLPKPQREVLVMRYYKNMSFKEIADATGVSINTALGRMRYAILNMRRIAKEKNIALSL